MAVTTPTYCSREDAQRATDIQDSLLPNWRLDRAIQSSARNIEGHLHRIFHPWDGIKFFDWPNYQYAYPWRLWLDRNDCLCITSFAAGGVAIGLDSCFLRPANPKPGFPFTSIELDRSTSAVFGGNAATPQNDIMIGGTWGFNAEADPAGDLAGDVDDAATAITVSDGSQVGVGDLLILGYGRGTPPFPGDLLGHAGKIAPYLGERILVTERSVSDTGSAQQGSSCGTASNADNQLQWTGGTGLNAGEAILLDGEQMLVLAVNALTSIATVKRAWNGTVLTSHSGAEIYAYRTLSVLRGYLGTTAAAHSDGAAVYKHRVPSLIRDLAVAESSNRLLQEVAGYSRTVGSGDAAMPASGMALADLWEEAETTYGRKNRSRVI